DDGRRGRRLVTLDASGDLLELAADVAQHHVADRELHVRVRGVDGPAGGPGGGERCGAGDAHAGRGGEQGSSHACSLESVMGSHRCAGTRGESTDRTTWGYSGSYAGTTIR